MKTKILCVCLLVTHINAEPKLHEEGRVVSKKDVEKLVGKSLKDLIYLAGNPDEIYSAENFSYIFLEGDASVVCHYKNMKVNVFLRKDSIILGVKTPKMLLLKDSQKGESGDTSIKKETKNSIATP